MPIAAPLRIATWNVQGGRLIERRQLIDRLIHQRDIDVLCLQDGRFYNGNYSTEHYDWIPSSAPPAVCRKYGCYLLLRKRVGLTHHQLTIGIPLEECFVVCHIQHRGRNYIIIGGYLPCNGTPDASPAFNLLDLILTKIRDLYPRLPLFLCGDLNSHLGLELHESTPSMTGLMGPHLFHAETNENGELLAGIASNHQLAAATTMFSSSVRVTRTHGSNQSQLDHVFVPHNLIRHITSLYGEWQPISDHKLVVMDYSSPETGAELTLSFTIQFSRYCIHRELPVRVWSCG